MSSSKKGYFRGMDMESPQQDLDIRRYLHLVYKKRYLFILTAASIITIAVAASYLMPKAFEATSIVFIERNYINQLIKDIATPSIEERIKALSIVIKSRTLILRVISDLDIDMGRMDEAEIERLVKKFQDNTEIKIEINKANRKDMDLFTVSYTDRNPKLARDYVNTLVRLYIEQNMSSKRQEAYGASRFISEQIAAYKEKIDRADAELGRVRSKKGFQMESRLLQLQKLMDALLVQYTASHPDVMKVKAEIESLQEQLRGNRAKRGRSGDAETGMPAAGMESTGEAPQGNANGFSNDRKKATDLERERDTYKKIYEELVANLGKSEVSTQVEVQDKAGTFRIIDPAVLPIKPASPNRVKIMLLGFVAGIAGGFLSIIFLDTLDHSVKKVDVLKGFGVPVLAVIPNIENAEAMAEKRKKDILVYSLTGVYILCVMVVFGRELLKSLA
jgi:succinoglycan biosynthesis transport protein ExoP